MNFEDLTDGCGAGRVGGKMGEWSARGMLGRSWGGIDEMRVWLG